MTESRIGNIYSYNSENDMLKIAKSLEESGYKVKRYYDDIFKNFKVKVIGYKN